MSQHWYAFFFALVNLAIIVLLNRYYLKVHRFFPFTIYADNEKMVGRNFFLSKKAIEIKYSEIKNISGGMFAGMPSRPVYLHGVNGSILIGFYARNNKFPKLFETILKNISEELYRELLQQIKKHHQK